MGATTSYGIEQGSFYGQRTNITWDNQWVAAYSPYYYYGSGMNCWFINTADPTKHYYYQNSTSSSGIGIAPFGEGKFVLRDNENNTNGNGLSFYTIDPTGAFLYGRNRGSTVSNGGSLSNYSNSYGWDAFSTTTNYAALVPMTSWTVNR